MCLRRYAAVVVADLEVHSSRGAAELVLDSDWPPVALLGSVGEWGDEGTNPNEERRFIVNRIHVATARRSRN